MDLWKNNGLQLFLLSIDFYTKEDKFHRKTPAYVIMKIYETYVIINTVIFIYSSLLSTISLICFIY